jgi:DNA-binding NtrC family response regulator
MPGLLIIDDDTAILDAFRYVFRDTGLTLWTTTTAAEGLDIARLRQPDVILLDMHLPDLSGLDTFRRLHEMDARTPVIFVTGSATTGAAIEAMRLGAYDYLRKEYLLRPEEIASLRNVVARAVEISRLSHTPAVVSEEEATEESDLLVGRCPAMQEVYKAIGRVAPQDVTVLIHGESGTGKELVARALYHYSRRSSGPFLALNCAAIPETLLESELFGHEKGSFTGADRKRIGKFEQCNGGTIFLDEVGDMPPLTQTKLLRLLQEQRFERVGGNETIQTDVRVLAATNRDLKRLVSEGRFRADLYYRLSVFTIPLPPLRERADDIPLLVNHFLKRYAADLQRDVRSVSPEALRLLVRHDWLGNVRELQSVLKQALLRAAGPVLLPEFVPALGAQSSAAGTQPAEPRAAAPVGETDWDRFLSEQLRGDPRDLYARWLELTDRFLLERVLRHTRGNQLRAARILGVGRASLRAKIRALGIDLAADAGDPGDASEEG